MDIQVLNKIRKERKYTYKILSEKSGIPLSTVQKIFGGSTVSPKASTLDAIMKALLDGMEMDYIVAETSPYIASSVIKMDEDTPKKKTLEDYYALSDDIRTELIDGVFYDMSSPTTAHQIILQEIWKRFSDYIEKNNGKCFAVAAPYDVRIKKDDLNIIQPDVMIICDKDKVTNKRAEGAPDLVVEVVSPSSVAHHRIRKLNLYLDSGVREFWLVDPINDEILVYRFEESVVPIRYKFNDRVPVGIYEGKCTVDFKPIMKLVDKWTK